MSTLRTLEDRHGGIRRQLRALSRDIAASDPEDLARLQDLAIDCLDLLGQAVRAMRDNGYSDGDIANGLGVSRAAVSKRWPGDGRYVGAAGRFRKTVEA